MATKYQEKTQDQPGVPADDQATSPEAIAAGHETTDVSIKGLTIFGVSLFMFLLGVLAAVAVFFKGYDFLNTHLDKRLPRTESAAASLVEVRPDYQGPLLQVKPEEDLRWMRQHNDEMLNHYGWVDRPNGVVRLPVERAMQLLAERGLPPVSPGKTMEALQQQRAQPQVYGQSLRP